jgi:hypothetical protein
MGVKGGQSRPKAVPHERDRVHQCAHLVLVNTSWQFGFPICSTPTKHFHDRIAQLNQSGFSWCQSVAPDRPAELTPRLSVARGFGSELRFHAIIGV